MNESKTPKIVVGVGLVAVYAGVAFYFLRDRPVPVALDAAAQPAAPLADTYVPSPAIAAESTELPTEVATQSAVDAGQAAVAVDVPSPQPRAAASPAAAEPRPSRAQARVETRVEQKEASVEPAQPSQEPTVQQPTIASESGEAANPASIGEVAATVDDSASPAAEVPSPVQEGSSPLVGALSGTDSQITADVRTQIAAVAPASDIEVTTTDGVVELSGSVPSHEDVNKVLSAARSVEHVRSVEASALMVAN